MGQFRAVLVRKKTVGSAPIEKSFHGVANGRDGPTTVRVSRPKRKFRFNLSLVIQELLGKGTPRGLLGLSADALLAFQRLWRLPRTSSGPDAARICDGNFAGRKSHALRYPSWRQA
jgi:hypothetical protein